MSRCISKKDFGKDRTNVGYALYVQDNIQKDDYARLTTGEIVQVDGIKENDLIGKAIYYNGWFDWFDSIACTNFSENIIDLIEVGDFVNGERILDITGEYVRTNEICHNIFWLKNNLKTILTKEQYNQHCYKVKENSEIPN